MNVHLANKVKAPPPKKRNIPLAGKRKVQRNQMMRGRLRLMKSRILRKKAKAVSRRRRRMRRSSRRRANLSSQSLHPRCCQQLNKTKTTPLKSVHYASRIHCPLRLSDPDLLCFPDLDLLHLLNLDLCPINLDITLSQMWTVSLSGSDPQLSLSDLLPHHCTSQTYPCQNLELYL